MRDPTTSLASSGKMIMSINFLDSEIYKIQEVWTGWEDLWYANDVSNSLPKSLQFLHPVSPSESPKLMYLKGTHHPDTLCHFAGLNLLPLVQQRRPQQMNYGQSLKDSLL